MRLNGAAVLRELQARHLSMAAFTRHHDLDYSHFYLCVKRGKSAGGQVLAALAREGIDIREVLLPAGTPAAGGGAA